MPESMLPTEAMQAALRDLAAKEQPIRRTALLLAGHAIVGEAQFDAPVDTGHLQNAHAVDDSDPDRIAIGANASYAAVVHETWTPPAGPVKNPNAKPRWFLRVIVQRGERILRRAIELAVQRHAGGGR